MSAFSVITAVGQDRPGIVAGVAEALWRLGCNLHDTSMTLLRSEFAMILLVRRPEGLMEGTLEAAMQDTGRELGLQMSCKELSEEEARPEPSLGSGYSASVYGADRPGIVYRVAAALAERGVNIVDLGTRVVGERHPPVYVMLLELDVPASVPEESLRASLEAVGQELAVSVSLRPLDEEAL